MLVSSRRLAGAIRKPLGSPGNGLRFLFGGAVLLACAGCTGSPESAEVAPAGVPTGASPMAPPTTLPTYEAGDESVGDTPSSSAGDPASGGAAAIAEVVVTYAEWSGSDRAVDVGGFVQGVITPEGRCTVRLSRGTTVLTGSAEAYADRSTTSCSAVRVALPEGAAGTWEGVLQFESGAVTAESAAFEVAVQ